MDIVTATLAIVIAPLALRNLLRKTNETTETNSTSNTKDAKDDRVCDCACNYEQATPQLPQEEEPPLERQPDSR